MPQAKAQRQQPCCSSDLSKGLLTAAHEYAQHLEGLQGAALQGSAHLSQGDEGSPTYSAQDATLVQSHDPVLRLSVKAAGFSQRARPLVTCKHSRARREITGDSSSLGHDSHPSWHAHRAF